MDGLVLTTLAKNYRNKLYHYRTK